MFAARLLLFLAASALIFSSAGAADDTGRFTRTLSAAERTEAGIDKLSSDEAAVLDAMVRRDTGARVAVSISATPAATEKPAKDTAAPATPTSFSQRLTADERRLCGFGSLSAVQIARIDGLVERHASASVARALLAPPTYLARRPRIEPAERDDSRKIHGSYSLSYGWGKGGYSERTGSMMMTYDDPAGRYSVTIGYTESHVKGGPGTGVYIGGPPYREP